MSKIIHQDQYLHGGELSWWGVVWIRYLHIGGILWYRKGTSIWQELEFGTSKHYGKACGSLSSGRIICNYTEWLLAYCIQQSFNSWSQFCSWGLESHRLLCSKCWILVTLTVHSTYCVEPYLCYLWGHNFVIVYTCIILSHHISYVINLVGKTCSNMHNFFLTETIIW